MANAFLAHGFCFSGSSNYEKWHIIEHLSLDITQERPQESFFSDNIKFYGI
jgi:hypothetical protein